MTENPIEFLDVPVLFGRFLVLNGILTEEEICAAARVQKDLNASPLFRLIEQGVLVLEDVWRARSYQWEYMVTFCEAVGALGIMSVEDCKAATEAIRQQNVPLGEVLVKQGRITPEALAEALQRHREHADRQQAHRQPAARQRGDVFASAD